MTKKLHFSILTLGIILCLFLTLAPGIVLATVDPRNNPNNKVGIGILSPEADINEAAAMVNENGDWGWVLIIIKKSERDVDRWQSVFNLLAKSRVIPIVRLATGFDSRGYWQRPTDEDADAWADFLSKLYWPTKNRYVQIYNEVNHANEWGGTNDPENYARELDKTISALKNKSSNFFVLNAPLDLAAASGNDSVEAASFLNRMEMAKPGIFKELDGWASHSYPNPAFGASPFKSGRTGIDGYKWELAQIGNDLGGRNLPVFITETGWRRLALSQEQVASFYEIAFKKVWSDNRVVAVTPFVFDYPDGLYHSFSFKVDSAVLGEKYYPQYEAIKNLPKETGSPARDDLAQIMEISLPKFILVGSSRDEKATFKNTGNFIWKADNLKLTAGSQNVAIANVSWNRSEILPGEQATATFEIQGQGEGDIDLAIRLSNSDNILVDQKSQVTVENYMQRLLRLVSLMV